LRKSKRKILKFAKLSAEKESSDDYLAIEKAKSKRIKEMEFSEFVYCKIHPAENSKLNRC